MQVRIFEYKYGYKYCVLLINNVHMLINYFKYVSWLK